MAAAGSEYDHWDDSDDADSEKDASQEVAIEGERSSPSIATRSGAFEDPFERMMSYATSKKIADDFKRFYESRGRYAEHAEMTDKIQALIPLIDRGISVTLRGGDRNINKIKAIIYSKRIINPNFIRDLIETVPVAERGRLLKSILEMRDYIRMFKKTRSDEIVFKNYTNFINAIIPLFPFIDPERDSSRIADILHMNNIDTSRSEIILWKLLEILPGLFDNDIGEEVLGKIISMFNWTGDKDNVDEIRLMKILLEYLGHYPEQKEIFLRIALEGNDFDEDMPSPLLFVASPKLIRFLLTEGGIVVLDDVKIRMADIFLEGRDARQIPVRSDSIKEMILNFDPDGIILNTIRNDLDNKPNELNRNVAVAYMYDYYSEYEGKKLKDLNDGLFQILRDNGIDYSPLRVFRVPPDELENLDNKFLLRDLYNILTPEEKAIVDEGEDWE